MASEISEGPLVWRGEVRWFNEAQTGQGELFEVTHVHRWEVKQGPHVVASKIRVDQPYSGFGARLETWIQWCYGCSSWVKFVEGVEITRP